MSRATIIATVIGLTLLVGGIFIYKEWQSRQEFGEIDQKGNGNIITPKDYTEYKNGQAGFSFFYPKTWGIEGARYGDGGDFYLTLSSPDIKEEELGIGGTDVVKGAKVYIVFRDRGNKTLEQLYDVGLTAELIDNGSVKPVEIQINSNRGVEYSLDYEGPPILTVVFLLGPNKYVYASLGTEGDEKRHPDYSTFKKILETIRVD